MSPIQSKALALVAVGRIEAKSAAEQQQRESIRQAMLSDKEAENLILSILRVRGGRGATEAEVTKMVNECVAARFMSACVDLACKGLVDVDYDPDKPEFDRLVFKRRPDIEDLLKEALEHERGQGG